MSAELKGEEGREKSCSDEGKVTHCILSKEVENIMYLEYLQIALREYLKNWK